VIEVTYDVGRRITLRHPACRIVSLVPSLTETLFALGSGDAVVGVTRYCTEPADAVQRTERIGGTKNPDVARIRALRPDVVLMNAEENRREDFEALDQAGLPVFVSFPQGACDVVDLLQRLGALTGATATAERMGAALQQTLGELERLHETTRVRVFCPIWKSPWMSFNRDTYTDDMLWTGGGDNVCRDRRERYCTVSLEEVAAAQPEVILLPDEPYAFREKDRASLAPLRDTPAYRTDRLHFIDGKALSWYGPRTAPGLKYLRSLMHAD
jgi:ABC-type Fe3+-hydroxamate transport system substrate-binding protein